VGSAAGVEGGGSRRMRSAQRVERLWIFWAARYCFHSSSNGERGSVRFTLEALRLGSLGRGRLTTETSSKAAEHQVDIKLGRERIALIEGLLNPQSGFVQSRVVNLGADRR
jgi:hypothetical protein